MDCSPPRPICPWDSPGKNTGVGGHALLQGIFPTQGSNKLRSPELANGLLTIEPAGKPYLSWFVLTDAFIILIFKKQLFIFFFNIYFTSPCWASVFPHSNFIGTIRTLGCVL